ncbi:MAG: double-cubane-cluster-containing anaerobic reductase [Negativicutes bacterium]|nr:double-cubane-cluster-containing anaerobic reductase [Negativicutes bacterium]
MSDISTELRQAKEAGARIVGMYCAYGPKELVLAAGALCFGLCSTKEEPIAEGEKTLPRNFCPLIKSSYGLAVTDKCPYFLYSDLIIGETTCDGKKKMFELMAKFKRLHVMRLPSNYIDQAAKDSWLAEVIRLKEVLEDEFKVAITDEKLRQAIKLLNEESRLMQSLSELMKNDPVPISGSTMLELSWQRNFALERSEFSEMIRNMIDHAKQRLANGTPAFPKGTKRIAITGVPTGIGADKVIKIIEECGAVVVYQENCSGMKPYVHLADENKPPLEAIAEKYLKIPCSCMSPNPARLESFGPIIRDYRVSGVVDIIWQGCHTYNVESRILQDYIKDHFGIPFLHIETDYSQGDREQIRTRVQAFLEMLD